jgi:hypothetical protein
VATVEITCPNCGASGGLPGPHETRICEFCGTHYLLRQHGAPPAEPEPDPEAPVGQPVDASAIVIAVFIMVALMAAAAVIIVLANTGEGSSKKNTPSYYPANR